MWEDIELVSQQTENLKNLYFSFQIIDAIPAKYVSYPSKRSSVGKSGRQIVIIKQDSKSSSDSENRKEGSYNDGRYNAYLDQYIHYLLNLYLSKLGGYNRRSEYGRNYNRFDNYKLDGLDEHDDFKSYDYFPHYGNRYGYSNG